MAEEVVVTSPPVWVKQSGYSATAGALVFSDSNSIYDKWLPYLPGESISVRVTPEYWQQLQGDEVLDSSNPSVTVTASIGGTTIKTGVNTLDFVIPSDVSGDLEISLSWTTPAGTKKSVSKVLPVSSIDVSDYLYIQGAFSVESTLTANALKLNGALDPDNFVWYSGADKVGTGATLEVQEEYLSSSLYVTYFDPEYPDDSLASDVLNVNGTQGLAEHTVITSTAAREIDLTLFGKAFGEYIFSTEVFLDLNENFQGAVLPDPTGDWLSFGDQFLSLAGFEIPILKADIVGDKLRVTYHSFVIGTKDAYINVQSGYIDFKNGSFTINEGRGFQPYEYAISTLGFLFNPSDYLTQDLDGSPGLSGISVGGVDSPFKEGFLSLNYDASSDQFLLGNDLVLLPRVPWLPIIDLELPGSGLAFSQEKLPIYR